MAASVILPSLLSAQINSDTAQRFPGVQERCREFSNQPFTFTDEVLDDMDGERETMAVRTDSDAIDGDIEGEVFLNEEDNKDSTEDIVMTDNVASSSDPITSTSSLTDIDSTGLRSVLKDASKGVSEGTHADYQRCG